jgi:hypothetical protein
LTPVSPKTRHGDDPASGGDFDKSPRPAMLRQASRRTGEQDRGGYAAYAANANSNVSCGSNALTAGRLSHSKGADEAFEISSRIAKQGCQTNHFGDNERQIGK